MPSTPSKSEAILWVDPQAIVFCTPASEWTDVNQHEAQLDHPHAFHNRGYFNEKTRLGTVLGGDWDQATLPFTDLLEYEALHDHISGIRPWMESAFARRAYAWIRSGKTSRGFADPDAFLRERSREVDALIESIKASGVQPITTDGGDESSLDNISVNISSNGSLLFNNRGHHRLAIAKILGLVEIPIQVIIVHEKFQDQLSIAPGIRRTSEVGGAG